MKKKGAIILAAVLITVLAGCKDKITAPAGNEFIIVTSFYPVYIIAMNIAGGIDGVRIVNMTPPVTGCLHDYSVTAGDMKKLETADILIVNGAGMESFIDMIARKYSALKIAELSKGITLIKKGEDVNPHVWVGVGNAILMAENCAGTLSESDPVHAAGYTENAARYKKRLDDLKAEMHRRLDRYRGRKIITFHEAFPYFAAEFGLEIAAVIEREPGSLPSAGELAETIGAVRKSNIKVIFTEPQYPSSSADIISKETGAGIFVLDPAVTGPEDRDAYLDIMKKNTAVIERAFK